MQIEPDVLRRHLEAAAIEQVAKQLRDEGYVVEEQVDLGSTTADLVATLGSKKAVYEFKVVGVAEKEWSDQASRLRKAAKRDGARFHLILVPWPGEIRVEVAGIERILENAFRTSLLPELRDYPPGSELARVTEVTIRGVHSEQGSMNLKGNAVATLRLSQTEEETEIDIIPFYFDIDINAAGEINSVQQLEIDRTY